MTNPVFFTPPGSLHAAAVSGQFTLEGAEARHAATVKRIGVGESVDIADGAGRRITGIVTSTVTESAPTALTVRVTAVQDEPPPTHELILVQALAKGDRDEQAVESATELGVDAVMPWQADRSIVRWRAEKVARGLQKWSSTVTAAAKQSRRSRIPRVEPLADAGALRILVGAVDLTLVLHEEGTRRLSDVVAALPEPSAVGRPLRIAVVVGPEGGISPRELSELEAAGAQTVRLGPHVLRSSSAGPAAITLLNHLLGRW